MNMSFPQALRSSFVPAVNSAVLGTAILSGGVALLHDYIFSDISLATAAITIAVGCFAVSYFEQVHQRYCHEINNPEKKQKESQTEFHRQRDAGVVGMAAITCLAAYALDLIKFRPSLLVIAAVAVFGTNRG